jgi:nickel superoxide dismutase
MQKSGRVFIIFMLFMSLAISAYSHCQVPCGIYGDQTRFTILREHITTIEKSMKQVNTLSKDATDNINQLVRWINNKDHHADEFTNIVTYYFLAQRVKIQKEGNKQEFTDYQNKVTVLHQMMVYSMKCKQTTDLKNVEKLKSLVDQFEGMYFTAEDMKHLKEHKK